MVYPVRTDKGGLSPCGQEGRG